MAARRCRAMKLALQAAFAAALAAPRGPRPGPVVPTTGLARCCRKRRVPVVAAAEQAYPRPEPLPAVPRHPAMTAARSDPRLARLLLPPVDRPSYLVVAAVVARAYPSWRVAAAVVAAVAARAYPSRPLVVAAARVYPSRAAAVARSCPIRPVVAERQPERPRRVAAAVVGRAYPNRRAVAARHPSPPLAAVERPRRVVAAVAARAFPSHRVAAAARHPSRLLVVGPSLVDRADHRPVAAFASCWH